MNHGQKTEKPQKSISPCELIYNYCSYDDDDDDDDEDDDNDDYDYGNDDDDDYISSSSSSSSCTINITGADLLLKNSSHILSAFVILTNKRTI